MRLPERPGDSGRRGDYPLDRVRVVDGGLEADRRDSSSHYGFAMERGVRSVQGIARISKGQCGHEPRRLQGNLLLGIPPQDNGQDRGPALPSSILMVLVPKKARAEFSNQGFDPGALGRRPRLDGVVHGSEWFGKQPRGQSLPLGCPLGTGLLDIRFGMVDVAGFEPG